MLGSFLILLASLFQVQQGKTHRVEVADITPQLKVFENEKYVPVSQAQTSHKALHFYIDAKSTRGNYLEIQSNNVLSLFIKGQLITHVRNQQFFNIDSLANLYTPSLSITLYKDRAGDRTLVKIVSFTTLLPTSIDPHKRSSNQFTDFLILSSGILIICFLLMVRTNSRLVLDYFNFIKLFSLQEREDNVAGAKISASFNLLIYLFACFLIALILLTIHNHSEQTLNFLGEVNTTSFVNSLIVWISLSLALFIGLFIKLTLLYSFSVLFDFKDFLSLQFLNFLRIIFFGSGIIILSLVGFLVVEVSNSAAYSFLFNIFVGTLLLWLVLVFFKLLNRTSNRMFHLFSYLCPSEIFPVLILIKVLFL